MELMSSLLLCVLVALLPQTLGQSEVYDSIELKRNYSAVRPVKKTIHSRVLLHNKYDIPVTSENTDLHAVFSDLKCQNCTSCMERAIKAHSAHFNLLKNRPTSEELQEDILMNQIVENRYKRDAPKATTPKKDSAKAKTTKPKKNKAPKSVSVTKYDLNGEVYALKVKETKESDHGKNGTKDTCQVYSIKSSLPCESPESNALLAEARRKSKKTDKTPKPSSTTPKARVAIYKKREVDNPDMPPEFMVSDEEMF